MIVETVKGHTYELSDEAVLALKAARTARQAEAAFSEHASHVVMSDRLDVWMEL